MPAGIVSTGWPAVRDKCRDLGVRFDFWQDGAGRLILAKDESGTYAATVGGVGLSLPRQVGKTYLIGAIVFALCILFPELTVIWTAHHSRTAGETFLSMQAFARRRKIAPYIDAVYKGSGDEEVRFSNGSRILFGARERGFGRGFAGVDVLVCDEAQILTDNALDNMLATMNTVPNALPIFMGTPPKPADPSESFARMRTEALSGESTDVAWIECGADLDADPDDREQWAKANPSYPGRTPASSILRLRKKLSHGSFLREGLGIWDADGRRSVLPGWAGCAIEDGVESPEPSAIGLAVSLDLDWGSIGAAGVWPDGRVHVGAVDRRPGSSWLVAEAKRIQDERGCAVVVDEKCPDADLIQALKDEGVRVLVRTLNEYIEGCSVMVKRVKDKHLTHHRTTDLDDAVDGAAWRMVGDRKVWGRRQSSSDVSMLEAVTHAAAVAARNPEVEPWGVFV